MYNQQAYEMGDNRCVIRDIAEYGAVRAQEVGAENVFTKRCFPVSQATLTLKSRAQTPYVRCS